ncbi:MAG TPA: EamA family transporter [Bryobacteraceae bacterium]|jgi:multidrug transporter EmrE-like cation transporter|nr:EamA family transporter [Bryobacteraceae bacterium]
MASSAAAIPRQAARQPNKSVYMVLGCTVFAATAQVLMKFGATHPMPAVSPAETATWLPFLNALLHNFPLLLGYTAHSCNAMLLILALREGELSMLYPIIALTYVWVNLLSMYFFGEHLNPWKAVGIALVIGGVALMGRASARS